VRNAGSSLKPEYIIKDQQGNARISFEESTTAGVPQVTQENSYYGTGMNMTSTMALPTLPNKNLYNGGSEWQNDYSSAPDYYQTLNRNYDAALGRFIAVDPMAEATESMSVYQYANNNPVMMNDPEGNYAQSLYYSFMSNPQAAEASPFSDPNFTAKMRYAFKWRGTDNMWNLDGGGNWLTNDVNGSGGSGGDSGATKLYDADGSGLTNNVEEAMYTVRHPNFEDGGFRIKWTEGDPDKWGGVLGKSKFISYDNANPGGRLIGYAIPATFNLGTVGDAYVTNITNPYTFYESIDVSIYPLRWTSHEAAVTLPNLYVQVRNIGLIQAQIGIAKAWDLARDVIRRDNIEGLFDDDPLKANQVFISQFRSYLKDLFGGMPFVTVVPFKASKEPIPTTEIKYSPIKLYR
jgi:RHS repeat-associated protein